jgi:hypothetical protein
LGVLALAILVALTPSVLGGGLAAERADRDQVRYTVSDVDSPFEFSYQAWSNQVPVVDGQVVLKG